MMAGCVHIKSRKLSLHFPFFYINIYHHFWVNLLPKISATKPQIPLHNAVPIPCHFFAALLFWQCRRWTFHFDIWLSYVQYRLYYSDQMLQGRSHLRRVDRQARWQNGALRVGRLRRLRDGAVHENGVQERSLITWHPCSQSLIRPPSTLSPPLFYKNCSTTSFLGRWPALLRERMCWRLFLPGCQTQGLSTMSSVQRRRSVQCCWEGWWVIREEYFHFI